MEHTGAVFIGQITQRILTILESCREVRSSRFRGSDVPRDEKAELVSEDGEIRILWKPPIMVDIFPF